MSIYSEIMRQRREKLKAKILSGVVYFGTIVLTGVVASTIVTHSIGMRIKEKPKIYTPQVDYTIYEEQKPIEIKQSSQDIYINPTYKPSSKDLFIQSVVDVQAKLEELRLLNLVNPFKDVGYQPEPVTEVTKSSDHVRQAPTSSYFDSLSDEDYQMLLRIVQAEAEGSNYEETLWTAHAITNRVLSDRFPNTLYEVIFANNGKGAYQFEPIANGRYFDAVPNDTVIKAVNECINNVKNGIDPTGGATFFMVPSYSSTGGRSWQENNTELIATIGTTEFRKYPGE